MPPATVTSAAPAKINWNLRVLHRRPDGYHEIESLISPLDFADQLTFSPREEPGLSIVCGDPSVPLDDRNLIMKAARLLITGADASLGATCRLVKQIPIGGGLGGGSSNAATALMALNELWQLGRSYEELSVLAAQIGSDVPLFLFEQSCIIRGRGERIEPAQVDFSGYIVLLMPPFSTSTAAVYTAIKSVPSSVNQRREGDAYPVAGLDARGWMERTFNDLEPAAQSVCPPLRTLMDETARLAGRTVRMSGSGSTLFTAFDELSDAETFAQAARARLNVQARVTRVQQAATDSSPGRGSL